MIASLCTKMDKNTKYIISSTIHPVKKRKKFQTKILCFSFVLRQPEKTRKFTQANFRARAFEGLTILERGFIDAQPADDAAENGYDQEQQGNAGAAVRSDKGTEDLPEAGGI